MPERTTNHETTADFPQSDSDMPTPPRIWPPRIWWNMWRFSHVDTRFFRHLFRFSPRHVWGYLLAFYALLGLVRTGIFSWQTWPMWGQTWESVRQTAGEHWPTGAVVRLQDNQVDLTPAGDSPLTLPLPVSLVREYQLPTNLLYLDPQLEASAAATPAAIIIANRENWWWRQGDVVSPAYRFNDLLTVSTYTIDQNWWDNTARWENWQADWLPVALAASLTWYGWLRLAARAVSLLFFSWLIQPLLWVMGDRLRFGATYRRGLLLLPLAEEIVLLSSLLYPNHTVFSFWLIWALAFGVVAYQNSRSTM